MSAPRFQNSLRIRLLSIGLLIVMTAFPAFGKSEMPWAKDYASAVTSAEATKKLIMVDFFADWCVWCKKLDADTFSQENVIKLSLKFVPLRLNAEFEGKELAKKYGAQNLPVVVLIDAEGAVWCYIQGYLPPETFATEISKGVEIQSSYKRALETLNTNNSDGEANAIKAYVDAQRGNRERAAERLELVEMANVHGRLIAIAYNATGEAFFRKGEITRATALYQKAMSASSDPYERAYASVSLAYCYQKAGNKKAVKQLCETVVQSPSSPRELVAMAKDILSKLSKS